ncbi:MAG: redoxin domain-containing protein [Rubripirellula sp.]|nr:redoxin domain-containing protein [Rubripirellula sp.]
MDVLSLCFRALLGVSVVCVSALDACVAAQESQPKTQPVLLQMIRDDAIHHELGLDDDQIVKLMDRLREIDPPWFRARILPSAKQREKIVSLTSQLRRSLQSMLDAKQLGRLRQLEYQALGTRMVLRDEVVRELELSDDQLQGFVTAFLNTDQESGEIQKAVGEGNKSAQQGNRELNELKTKERQSLIAKLTPGQKAKLGSVTGEAFSFSEIRRSYPFAPELTASGVTWIQGGPLSLEAMRGKVVAVHFYAFQCINCQRNFDHYQRWYEDYADDGLVIIGIQTPETSAERQLDRVTSAVKSDGMTYPVLLDGESQNWKAWSNTMWPTLYVVDRKGFLRRWWQGELNWKGTPGEQQMRETIEQLLAEK